MTYIRGGKILLTLNLYMPLPLPT